MALMTPQPVSAAGTTPVFTPPTVSDTITPDTGLILYLINGATSSTVTVLIPGNQPLSGVPTTDTALTFVSGSRAIFIAREYADPITGLITVTYSSVATMSAALLKV